VLSVKGRELNDIGLLIDFNDLKTILKKITGFLDHKNINEIPPFDILNPSSELIAEFICNETSKELKKFNSDIEVESVTVWESGTSRCTYYPE